MLFAASSSWFTGRTAFTSSGWWQWLRVQGWLEGCNFNNLYVRFRNYDWSA